MPKLPGAKYCVQFYQSFQSQYNSHPVTTYIIYAHFHARDRHTYWKPYYPYQMTNCSNKTLLLGCLWPRRLGRIIGNRNNCILRTFERDRHTTGRGRAPKANSSLNCFTKNIFFSKSDRDPDLNLYLYQQG